MVGDVIDVCGEEAFVFVVDAGGDVRPPVERLRERGAVVEAGLQLHDGRTGPEADAVRAFEPVQRVVVGHPRRNAAVLAALDRDFDRHESRGAVVLRPVELHAAGEPRTGEAHEGGLDDGVPVEEVVVAVRLVLADVYAPAELRQDHDARKVVFERDGVVLAHFGLVHHLVDEGDGIDLAAASLVDAFFEEHRVLFGRAHGICFKSHRGSGAFDFSAERGGSGRRERGQKEEGLFFHSQYCTKIAICFPSVCQIQFIFGENMV